MIKTESRNKIVGLIVSFISCAVIALLFSFKTMTIVEGWHSEYAWQINHGNLPYRDFEYLFFPLYMFIIAGFTNIFGYSIVALRILGVFVFGMIGATIYLVFEKVFDSFSAVFSSIVTCIYIQSEITNVFYDYIRFHDLCAYIALVCLVYATELCLKEKVESNRLSKFFQIITPILLGIVSVLGLLKYFHQYRSMRFLLFFVGFCVALVWGLLPQFAAFLNKAKAPYCRSSGFAIACGFAVSAECMIKQSNGTIMIAFVIIYFLFCGITTRKKSFINEILSKLGFCDCLRICGFC